MNDIFARTSRELDSRGNLGIRIDLCWSPADDRTWVAVCDLQADSTFILPVLAGERARDVFDHPYGYAARRGVQTIVSAA